MGKTSQIIFLPSLTKNGDHRQLTIFHFLIRLNTKKSWWPISVINLLIIYALMHFFCPAYRSIFLDQLNTARLYECSLKAVPFSHP
jgi:hypothetical protein